MKSMLLFPARYIGYEELYYSLKSMNLNKILVICEKEFMQDYNLKGNFIDDDFKSEKRLIEKIGLWVEKNNVKLIGIIGIDDEEQFKLSKKLSLCFNIRFYDDETLNTASNKYIMKTRFKKYNVPTGKCALIEKMSNEIKFPNVLKTITGTGSEFIFLNKNESDLKKNIEILKNALKKIRNDKRFRIIEYQDIKFDPRRQFLLEEYAEGEEYSCDFSVYNKKIQILRIVKKYQSEQIGYYKGFYLMNEKNIRKKGINDLNKVCANISRAFNIQEGVCMVDFKVNQGKINVIESSIRPGLSTFIPLMQRMYGYTSLGIYAKMKLGLATELKLPKNEGVVVYLLAERGGVLKHLKIIKNTANIINITKFTKPGDKIIDIITDHTDLMVGYILIKNPENADKIFETKYAEIII
ncbi:MAG: ATP-grasp domain-containing protein [Nanoarchaeota archaeon]